MTSDERKAWEGARLGQSDSGPDSREWAGYEPRAVPAALDPDECFLEPQRTLERRTRERTVDWRREARQAGLWLGWLIRALMRLAVKLVLMALFVVWFFFTVIARLGKTKPGQSIRSRPN